MKANVLLADTGTQDPNGKLHLLGVGWSQTQIGPTGLTADAAVAVLLEVPWDRCNREIEIVLELVNEDGMPVALPTGDGPQPLRIAQTLVIPSPPGAPTGSTGHANLLVQLQGGLPLNPGAWYSWRVTVDKETHEAWQAKFFVQRQQSAPTFGAPPMRAGDLPTV